MAPKLGPGCFYGAYVVSKSWLASNETTAEKFLTAITLAHRDPVKVVVVPLSARSRARQLGHDVQVPEAAGVLLREVGQDALQRRGRLALGHGAQLRRDPVTEESQITRENLPGAMAR